MEAQSNVMFECKLEASVQTINFELNKSEIQNEKRNKIKILKVKITKQSLNVKQKN